MGPKERLHLPAYQDRYPTVPVRQQHSVSLANPDETLGDHVASATTQLLTSPMTRPCATRSCTEPGPSTFLQQSFSTTRPSSSHRNRSPFSRSHLRSRSTGAALSVPVVLRAHSSPSIPSTSRASESSTPSTGSLTPGSPLRSPARQHSPLRSQEDSNSAVVPPRSPRWLDASYANAIEAIQEDSELELTPKPHGMLQSSMPLQTVHARSAAPRRRPQSPLHSATSAVTSVLLPATIVEHPIASASASPSPPSQRFNESYPSLHHYASNSSFSSMPSTPTSQRSRSPSISSLDTIEDAPEMENEAIELERLERLKLAAERAERAERGEDNEEGPRRSSLDAPRGFGFSRGSNREKKRWSVCGGERRADLDLETIYED